MAGAFALALTLPLLLSTAHAHPGRTDANGGHTNHDTGEYHYHHGYEAHDHYDIDGDGTIDCPYDFVDKTGQNSGTSSGNSTDGNWSGTSYPDATHETFSRLDLTSEEVAAPSSSPIVSSEPEPTFDWSEIPGFSVSVGIVLVALALLFAYICRSCCQTGDKWSAGVFGILGVLCVLPLRQQLMQVITAVGIIAYAAFLLSPFIYLIKLGIEKLIKWWKSRSTARSIVPEQPQSLPYPKPVPTPVPPQPGPDIPDDGFNTPDPEINFRPNPGLESEVSVHARCHDTCCYLWYETLLIRSCVSPPLSSNSTIYIWTALFYTAVKTLRSQDSVNRIYSYFSEATGRFVTEIQYRDLVVEKVREVYRSIRPLLNASDIDPRTDNGRRDLWLLIARLIPEGNDPQLQAEFEAAAGRIWKTIADVFPQAHPYPKAGDIRYSIDDLPET